MENHENKYLIDLLKMEVKVKRVKSGKKILAQGEIIFDGINQVKGFKIIKSQNPDKEYVVFPPSYPIRPDQFQDVWWIKDIDLWHKIENKIIKAYSDLELEEDCKDVFENESL